MASKKTSGIPPTNTEIRRLMLRYFHERNSRATSSRGKKGSAVKISDIKKELKALHGLTQPEVQSNLTYLISERWVEEQTIEKTFTARGGTVIPSTTSFYQITAAGIDKVEGPGEFTMSKFHGINIQATGQSIITVGDGNQIDAKYGDVGQSLAELRQAITSSDAPDADKMGFVADIDTIQSQLAKHEPNRGILAAAWNAVKASAAINGCSALVAKVAGLIGPLI